MQPSTTGPVRVFSALVLAFGVVAGAALLDGWVRPGTVPSARGWLAPWPLAVIASGAAILGAGLVRRADVRALALGALAWAVGVLAVTELPTAASTHHVGDGPWLVPGYLAAALGAGLYAVLGWRGHTLDQRAAALLLFFASANARMFARDEGALHPLLLAIALVGFVGAERRIGLRELVAGPGRAVAWIAIAFLVWTLAASLAGASPTHSVAVWSRPLLGALVAWTLAGALGPVGVRRAFGGLIAGVAVALAVLCVGVLEVSQVLGFAWLRVTRLRLFDLHPGLIAPFLAVGVCLALARAVEARQGRPLVTSLSLVVAVAVALALNQARASLAGASVGVVAFALAYRRALPRRPLAWGAALFAVVLLAVGALASPLGAGVREVLAAKAETASALGQRYHYWRMAGAAVRRDPLLGQGLLCEWARTDLAQPSYLDGGDQWLHAHNLLFSIAEGAGVPAGILFLLLVLAALELGRRAVLSAQSSRERAIAAGLLAALIAHLTANVLSMGQAVTTVVPLFLWIAIGLFAALLRGSDDPRVRGGRGARVAFAAVFLAAFGVAPLAGRELTSRGDVAYARGNALRAERLYELALAVNPLDPAVQMRAAQAAFAHGNREGALERIERACDAAPRLATRQSTRGGLLLGLGRHEEAARAFELAIGLDPRGRQAGDFHAGLAAALLRMGDAAGARMALARSLRHGSDDWRRIRQVRLPARPGDPPDAARVAFPIGDSDESLRLDDVVARIALDVRAALAQAPPDLKTARRLLGQAVTVYRAENLVAEPLALLEDYAAAVPERFSSTDTLYSQVLLDAGRVAEADAVVRSTPGRRAHVPGQELLRYYRARTLTDPAPELFERAQEIAQDVDLLDQDDVWFVRGERAELYGFLAELALRRGDAAAAERFHAFQHFDLEDAWTRASACAALLQSEADLAVDDAVLAREAAHLVRQLANALGDALDDAQLRGPVRVLADAWEERSEERIALLEDGLAGTGQAGERFVALLRETLAER
jgi:tetratricopeptide (TPR) repeat protein